MGVALIAAGLSSSKADEQTKASSIWQQQTLTGDWGGARTALAGRGVDITLNYIAETFAVLSGGLEQRGSYEGRAELSVDTDLQKLIGWTGAITHVTIYQIHNIGHVDSENDVGAISDPSNIDAWATTRLFTAWFQQELFSDRLSVRAGQLAADDEFMTCPTAAGLNNATFGWPNVFAANMPSGGPAYPLATPGVRLKLAPIDKLTLLAAVFSGDPAGSNCDDINRQKCDRYGTKFSFSGGALWMGEAQYAINQGKEAVGLPGAYKLGIWYHTAEFADEHFGLGPTGAVLTLADPSMPGPLNHRGNWGIYGLADQTVWRQGGRSLNVFVRGGGSPSDRNFLSYYVDGGAGITGLLPGRRDDVLTFGIAYTKISRDIAALDQDSLAINGPPYVVRDREVVFEASYAAQIAPWWIVQPDLQYIVYPNGGQNPDDPTLMLKNAFLAGIRSTIKF